MPTPPGKKRNHFHPDRIKRLKERHAPRVMLSDKLKRVLVRTVRDLTPPNCMECSTHEVVATIDDANQITETLTIRGVSMHLRRLRDEGLLKSTVYMQRNLWSLTPKGRRWLDAE